MQSVVKDGVHFPAVRSIAGAGGGKFMLEFKKTQENWNQDFFLTAERLLINVGLSR